MLQSDIGRRLTPKRTCIARSFHWTKQIFGPPSSVASPICSATNVREFAVSNALAASHAHRAALPRQPSARDLIAELRRHRKALGLKQYVFALEAGIPQPRLCGYETGRLAGERMELRTLLRWIEALGGQVTVVWE